MASRFTATPLLLLFNAAADRPALRPATRPGGVVGVPRRHGDRDAGGRSGAGTWLRPGPIGRDLPAGESRRSAGLTRPRDRHSRRFGLAPQRLQRSSTDPTVKPAPTEPSSTRSFFFSRPSARASASARGIVAAVVLPYVSRLMTTCRRAQPEPIGGGLDDPAVGLVRDVQVDVGAGEAVALEHAQRDLLALLDRELEHRLAVLLDEVQPLVDRLVRGRQPAAAGRHAAAPRRPCPSISCVKSMMPGSSVRRRRQHDRARAVAEENARRAIGVVDDARHHVGADDQRVLDRAGRHHRPADAQRVGEPGAGRAQIEAPAPSSAPIFACSMQAVLGKIVSGVVVPTTMNPMSSGSQARLGDGRPRGRRGDVRRRYARIDDVPLADARCAAGSTRRSCRPSSRGRRWSTAAAARTCRVRRSSRGRTVFTTDDPFLAPSGRNTRTPARWPRGRAACGRESRSG